MKAIRLVFLCLLLTSFVSPVNDVKLEYVFKIGDVYTLRQTTKQTIKQSIMGTEQNGENSYSGQMTFKIVELTATGARLETQFLSLKNSSKTVMGDVTMDSDGQEENAQNKFLKSMMRKTFYVTMNKTGLVETVEGTENLWSGLSGLGLDETTMMTTRQSLEQLLSPSSLKNSMEQAMVYYADRKVKPGDTWSSKNDFPLDFPIQVDNSWTLASLTAASAKVNADGIYKTTDKKKTIDLPGGIKANVDLDGKQTTRANVDVKTGWPSDLVIHSDLKGKMTLLAGGMLPEDMEVPMQILTETTYQISRK